MLIQKYLSPPLCLLLNLYCLLYLSSIISFYFNDDFINSIPHNILYSWLVKSYYPFYTIHIMHDDKALLLKY